MLNESYYLLRKGRFLPVQGSLWDTSESQSDEDRIHQLELALKKLAEQNAKLASEVEILKLSINASPSTRPSTSVLDDVSTTVPPVSGGLSFRQALQAKPAIQLILLIQKSSSSGLTTG